jgi:hypothetical protein
VRADAPVALTQPDANLGHAHFAGTATNAIVWAVPTDLACAAVRMVAILGPFGLILLGLLTVLLCTLFDLNSGVPTEEQAFSWCRCVVTGARSNGQQCAKKDALNSPL